MNKAEQFAAGFYIILIGTFVGMTILLSQGGFEFRAKVIPYITAAIAVPLLVFKFSRTTSDRMRAFVDNLRQSLGLDPKDISQTPTRPELLTLGWLLGFVAVVYIFGIIVGILIGVTSYISYHEQEYVRAVVIALMIAALTYALLPLFFGERLWSGLIPLF